MNFAFKPYLKKLAAYYYNMGAKWGKDVAINYKYDAMPVGTGVLNIERGQLSEIRGLLWQADTCVSKKSWGYIENDEFKTPEHILCDLADIVSKNGVMLLNVGPRPDGTIPEEVQKILAVVGEWLEINGEAIYDTKTWNIHGEGPTHISDGAFTETRGEFSGEDIRFTASPNGGILYAIVLNPPKDGTVCVKNLYKGSGSLQHNIQKAEMLDGGAPLEWERTERGLIVKLGKSKQSLANCPVVIKICR
jgi:alpha-L-fucosidase